jgi:DNA-binding NarL/FixJ family response regulator
LNKHIQHKIPLSKKHKKNQKHKVAIIDPSPIFQSMLLKIISDHVTQADIAVADTIDQAAQIIKTESPDLLFVDIALFPKNCIDHIKSMKEFLPALVIVVLTTHDSAEYRTASLENGADYFLSKTETPVWKLIDLIENILL